MTIMDNVKAVNALLLAGEPHNITEEKRTSQTYTGYAPQYIIDAMNTVFDIGGWGFEEISNEIAEVQTKSGAGLRAVAKVRVWIKDVAFHPTAYGQANVTLGDIGDAKKGAQTDAIKKALSYFSVGNRAYMGLLPGDKQANSQRTQQQPRPVQQSTKPATPRAPVQPTQPPTNPVSSIQTQKPAHDKKVERQFTKMEEIPTIDALKAEAKEAGIKWVAVLRRVECDGIAEDAISPEKCLLIAQIIKAYKAKNGGEALQKAS